jgi:hypothetical protein
MALNRIPDTATYYSLTECLPDMEWFAYSWGLGGGEVACFDYLDFLAVLAYWNADGRVDHKPI